MMQAKGVSDTSNNTMKRIVSNNLIHYMHLNNKIQKDIINDLKFDKSAVSSWINATKLPP